MPESGSGPRCLIVADGDVLVRNALSDYLRACGYHVIDAATSDEVMTALDEAAVAVDVILADAELAGSLNAFSLRLWVKQHHPHVDTVLAGNVDAAARAAGDLCDDGPHLSRPYEPEAVAAHIKRLLARARK
jgi:DNA-binding NtrC family response regulator